MLLIKNKKPILLFILKVVYFNVLQKFEQLLLKTIEINDSIIGPDNIGLKPLLNTLVYFDTNIKVKPDGAKLHRERLAKFSE